MKKTPNQKIDLEKVPGLLTPVQKEQFFDAFWKAWSVNGFGTMTKKDSELLIFGCLKRAFGESGPKGNYEWARLLRLTPAKIKSMRLEAHLRFGHLFGESDLTDTEKFFKEFAVLQSIDIRGLSSSGDLGNVTVSFVVEDPVVQMVIENDLKTLGTFLDFHRNREVIRFRLTDLFKLLTTDAERKSIDNWVAAAAKENAEASAIRKRVAAAEWANKTEAGKLMTFADDLAEFTKVSVLTDRLKTIFGSQSERK
jgi:hypothetical protein